MPQRTGAGGDGAPVLALPVQAVGRGLGGSWQSFGKTAALD